jgi:hypothetical protein
MTEFHYVLTVQWQDPRGVAQGTFYGVHEAAPGSTRAQAFAEIRSYAEQQGVPAAATVVFFSLERDDLGV